MSTVLIIRAAPVNAIVKYKEFDFDNDFAHGTIYRGPPSPALEEAWEKLWNCEMQTPITKGEAEGN